MENLLAKLFLDHALLDGLHDLRAHGITYPLLFPDLMGVAMNADAEVAQRDYLL